MSVLPLYAEDYTQTAIFVWNSHLAPVAIIRRDPSPNPSPIEERGVRLKAPPSN
jgi:hypothetical protein